MKKFKFKLASVLRYRQILKDLQEAKLMKANQACTETEALLEGLAGQQHEVYKGMMESAESRFSLEEHRNFQAFNHMLISERSKEKTRLARRKKAQEFEQTRYVAMSQKLMAIEKLEDKALELHRKEVLDEEMKQIDDLVNSRSRVNDY